MGFFLVNKPYFYNFQNVKIVVNIAVFTNSAGLKCGFSWEDIFGMEACLGYNLILAQCHPEICIHEGF